MKGGSESPGTRGRATGPSGEGGRLRSGAPMPRTGIFYGLGAFGFWGVFPLYFKALQAVPPLEILCHRISWSVPVAALLLLVSRQGRALGNALSLRVLATLCLTALLVSVNWLLFIYAITTGRVLEASLGYFINPLVNVLLGMVFLGERLSRGQTLAVLLAFAGTLNQSLVYGQVPWISLSLGLSFGLYGFFRKTVRIDALGGLFVETLLLFPLASWHLLAKGLAHTGAFLSAGWGTSLLLSLSGLFTVLPLLWFTLAARSLPLSTVGILQYLAPSLHFTLAVFFFKEPFTWAHLVTFSLIWSGLSLYMAESLRAGKAARPQG